MPEQPRLPTGHLLKMYLHLRDQRDAHVKSAKDYGAQMAKVEAVILNRMITDETDRMAADGVVAFKSVQDKAHVSDFARVPRLRHLGRAAGHADQRRAPGRRQGVPGRERPATPGVALNSIVKVNVRKG
jgi:hypothetical protein